MGASCAEMLMKVKILPNTDKYFQIGTSMKNQDKVEMLLFLMQNVDVFAWSPYEVPGVDLSSLSISLTWTHHSPQRSRS